MPSSCCEPPTSTVTVNNFNFDPTKIVQEEVTMNGAVGTLAHVPVNCGLFITLLEGEASCEFIPLADITVDWETGEFTLPGDPSPAAVHVTYYTEETV